MIEVFFSEAWNKLQKPYCITQFEQESFNSFKILIPTSFLYSWRCYISIVYRFLQSRYLPYLIIDCTERLFSWDGGCQILLKICPWDVDKNGVDPTVDLRSTCMCFSMTCRDTQVYVYWSPQQQSLISLQAFYAIFIIPHVYVNTPEHMPVRLLTVVVLFSDTWCYMYNFEQWVNSIIYM